MKKEQLILTAIICLLFAVWAFVAAMYYDRYEPIEVDEPIEVVEDTVDTWEQMVLSLIQVESEGNDLAFNETSGASGCLQITDIYIAEVNRLLGEDRYCKDDAFDRTKSLEMFEVYQSNKNPNRDIDTAIRLHNPKAGEWYLERVKNAMK